MDKSAGSMAQMVEHLSSMCMALGSILNKEKKKKLVIVQRIAGISQILIFLFAEVYSE
jgi:hypothetical protein